MKSINYFLLIVLAVVMFRCSQSNADASESSAEASANPSLEKITLKKDTLEGQMTIPGELIANQQVDLYAKVTGFVKELKVDIGSKVKTGQVLIVLEAPEMAAQLSAAQSRLKSQEATYTASLANYNRLVEVSKTPGTISQNDLEQAEARKNADMANLEAAKASYKEVNDVKDYLVIRAPFDGTITARNINVGAYVGPSGRGSEAPALILQQQDKLRLVVAVPEAYTSYLKKNDEIDFKVRSMPSENFKAKIVRLSGALDLKFRSQRIEADIANPDGKFLAGTVADVKLKMRSSENAFVVPNQTVISSAEGSFVVRVVDQKAQRVSVKKGLQFNGLTEIFGDLSVGDVLLKKGNEEIRDGAEVR
ncbi:MAG TPA: efflux RND transporter periplasmic adaptor subunit [Cyclobacteriaceae bacterium]|nr:efflux RND transporter periplasmic adaptor subunit [Cyclobacteriaceae bacterium]